MLGRSSRRYGSYIVVIALATVLWSIVIVPTGFSARELAAFVAPGAVLAVGARWASYLLRTEALTTKKLATAAFVGATILPPFIGFGIALLSAFNRSAVVAIFVLGAWAALAGGFIVAAALSLRDDLRAKRRAASARAEPLPPGVLQFRRSPPRAEPLHRGPATSTPKRQPPPGHRRA